MKFLTRIDGAQAALSLEGRFTFEYHQEFKEAVYPILEMSGIHTLRLDLSGTTYMDSSTLGMLLLLREKADVKGIKVAIFRPSSSVMTILKVVQFDRLFDIQN